MICRPFRASPYYASVPGLKPRAESCDPFGIELRPQNRLQPAFSVEDEDDDENDFNGGYRLLIAPS